MKKSIVRYSCGLMCPIAFMVLSLLPDAGEAESMPLDQRVNYEKEIVRPDLGEVRHKPYDVLPFREVKRPKIGLVLSGGGARGAAHLGVIEVLEEYGIPIDFISGASMGSLIGGLYAMGYSTESLNALVDTTDWSYILAFGREIDRRDLFVDQKLAPERGLFTLRFDGIVPVIPASVTPAQRLSSFINELVLQAIYHPDQSYDDLRIPFRTVASDIITGERVVFDRGDLVQALRASISIPLIFAPVKMNGMLLVDGGLVSNIPVDIARQNDCDIVIAVNTTSGMRQAEQLGAPWEIADQIITIMQQRWNRDQLRLADIVITPPIENYLGSDFENIRFFLEEGRRSARQAVGEILNKIDAYYAADERKDTVVYTNVTLTYDGGFHDRDIAGKLVLLSDMDDIPRSGLTRTLNNIYMTGRYRDVYATVERRGVETSIVLYAEPNPILETVVVSGNNHLPTDSLTVWFSEFVGKPLNVEWARLGSEEILKLYRKNGYSLARINAVDFDESSGMLTVTVNEGIIGNLSFEGNYRTRGYVIRREFPLRPGDVFRVDEAMQGVRNITGTGLFDQVLLDFRNNESETQVVINVTERYSDLVRLSMRIDEVYHFQPMIELRNQNLWGHGMQVGLSIGGGLQNRLYQADYIAHRIFDTYFSAQFTGFYRFDDIPVYIDDPETPPGRNTRIQEGEYRQRKFGTNFSIGTQFERLGNLSATLRIERHEIDEREPGDFTPHQYRLIAQRFTSIFDTFDRYPYPEEGVGLHAYYETALSILGSEVSYSRFFISYESYNTYRDMHTFRPRLIFGFGDETLPLSEHFNLGGKDNFYGLREYDRRGRQIFLVNLEYRLKLPIKIIVDTYFHARYDVGSVWTAPQDIHLNDLVHGIGIGLGFDTPVFGPIEIAIGRAYRSRGEGIDATVPSGPLQTYFSIGYPLP
jgi:NTE family protein